MINKLIDINPIITYTTAKPKEISSKPTILDYAASFVNGMSETQRNRFKKMLESGIECGLSVAESYDVNYSDFIKEVKKLLMVEV